MSAFDYNEKDDVVDAIRRLAESERNDGKTTREIITSILGTVNYSIDSVLYIIEQTK